MMHRSHKETADDDLCFPAFKDLVSEEEPGVNGGGASTTLS